MRSCIISQRDNIARPDYSSQCRIKVRVSRTIGRLKVTKQQRIIPAGDARTLHFNLTKKNLLALCDASLSNFPC